MKKLQQYTGYIKQKLVKVLEYRSEIIIWIFLDFLPFSVLFILWQATTAPLETIKKVIIFYVAVAFIQGVSSSHFDEWRAEEVRMGKIDMYLTKPLSYIAQIVLTEVAGKLFYLALFLPLYVLFVVSVQTFIPLAIPSISLGKLILFILLLVCGFSLHIMLSLWVVFSAFWLESARGLQHFKWILIALTSGSLIPDEFLPRWLQIITLISPFQFMFKVPLDLLLQGRLPSPYQTVYLLSTLVVAMITTRLFWQRAVAQYVSAGG